MPQIQRFHGILQCLHGGRSSIEDERIATLYSSRGRFLKILKIHLTSDQLGIFLFSVQIWSTL